MPASRFLALSAAIPAIEAAQDMRLLRVTAVANNPGERGQAVRNLSAELLGQAQGRRSIVESSPVLPGITIGVQELADSNSIRTELERKRKAFFEQEAVRRLSAAG